MAPGDRFARSTWGIYEEQDLCSYLRIYVPEDLWGTGFMYLRIYEEESSKCDTFALEQHPVVSGNGLVEIWQKRVLQAAQTTFLQRKETTIQILDVDPQRDDDASPMSTYRCMLRPTWMISALQHKSKYKSNSISNFFEKKKNQIFWFPCCSTREDLSVDVSITHVGLILTNPGRFFFSAYGNSGYGQNSILSISNFLKKFSHFWVSMV